MVVRRRRRREKFIEPYHLEEGEVVTRFPSVNQRKDHYHFHTFIKKNIRIIVFIEKNDLKKIFTFFLLINKEGELLKIFIKNFYKNLKRKKKSR